MDTSFKLTKSIIGLNENLVRVDSSNPTQPLMSIRIGQFSGVPYATKNVLSTLPRSWLKDLNCTYQIPKSANLSRLWRLVYVFPSPYLFRQLLTHLRLALGQVMPNG